MIKNFSKIAREMIQIYEEGQPIGTNMVVGEMMKRGYNSDDSCDAAIWVQNTVRREKKEAEEMERF